MFALTEFVHIHPLLPCLGLLSPPSEAPPLLSAFRLLGQQGRDLHYDKVTLQSAIYSKGMIQMTTNTSGNFVRVSLRYFPFPPIPVSSLADCVGSPSASLNSVQYNFSFKNKISCCPQKSWVLHAFLISHAALYICSLKAS